MISIRRKAGDFLEFIKHSWEGGEFAFLRFPFYNSVEMRIQPYMRKNGKWLGRTPSAGRKFYERGRANGVEKYPPEGGNSGNSPQ